MPPQTITPPSPKGNDFHYISVLISVVVASPYNKDPNIRNQHSNSWAKIASFYL